MPSAYWFFADIGIRYSIPFRATPEEKKQQLDNVRALHLEKSSLAQRELANLKAAAVSGQNIFVALMSAARVCSLGQMTSALYEVGGRYRRNV